MMANGQLRPAPRELPSVRQGAAIALLGLGCFWSACTPLKANGDETADPSPGATVVVGWNQLAYEIAYAEDQFLTFKGQRALAMMNLAMHDALNTISRRYDRYAYAGAPRTADAELSAAQAAYEILRTQYPDEEDRLRAKRTELRRPESDPVLRANALEIGSEAAAAILRKRDGDGWDEPGGYEFASDPGRYQTTPDWDGFVLQPGFGQAQPFAIPSSEDFLPPAPPELSAPGYADAYHEVKALGAKESNVRSPDQTDYAIWWMEFSEGSVNRLARRMAMERGTGLWEAARLFAHLHMALYDAYVVTWDGKYAYDHWRPFTAIRIPEDGNDATVSDPEWLSQRPAPPFPEYPSAHAAGCAAAFEVLAQSWEDAGSFTMTTITAPVGMPDRTFPGFRAAAEECADSRVQLGWHFRYSTDAGLELGRSVADHVLRTHLRPL